MTDHTTNAQTKELGAAIKGMNSAQLEYTLRQIQRRYAELREERKLETMSKAEVGATARFVANTKPKYLGSLPVQIEEIRENGDLVVRVINPSQRLLNRFRGGRIRTTASSIIVD